MDKMPGIESAKQAPHAPVQLAVGAASDHEEGHDPEQHHLAEFDDTIEARRLARLEADNDLYWRLAYRGFEGKDWDRFVGVLVGYGQPVLKAWIMTDLIVPRVFEKTRHPIPKRPHDLREPDAEELAVDTIAAGIPVFRTKVLIPAVWNPEKGASLKTYFVGQLLLRYPDVYRRWLTAKKRWDLGMAEATLDAIGHRDCVGRDPADRLVTDDTVREALASIRADTTKQVLVLRSMGYPNAAIAEALDISIGAVESRLDRHKNPRKRRD